MLNKDRRPKSRVNQEGAHMKMDEYRTKKRKNMSLNLTMESEKIQTSSQKRSIQHKWITTKRDLWGKTELFVIFSNISLRA